MKNKFRPKMLIALSAVALASAPAAQGSFQVVKTTSFTSVLGIIGMLTGITAIAFIVILLACGMRDPIL